MHNEKTILKIFKRIAEIVVEEAESNPAFSEKLENALSSLTQTRQKRAGAKPHVTPPDVFAMCQQKSEDEFKRWLVNLEPETLKAIIKFNGFDPGKRSRRWVESEKLAELVFQQTKARLNRGSAFLTAGKPTPEKEV